MRPLLLFTTCVSAWAAATLPTPAITSSVSVPASAIDAAGSFHIQARVHGASLSGPIFNVGGYGVSIGNGLLFFAAADGNTPGTGNCNVALAGTADLTIDITRDLTWSSLYPYGSVRGEVFNTATGQFVHSCTFTITGGGLASGKTITAAGISIGGNGASGTIEFIRWYPGAFSTSLVVQPYGSSPATWLDYEFSSSSMGIDTSHYKQRIRGLNFTNSGASLPPVCSAGNPQTFSMGSNITLSAVNSYSLNGNPSLTYSWSYAGPGSDNVTQTPTYASPAAVTTSVTGLTKFGSFNSQLVVTDSDNNSTTCVAHDGIVITTNPKGRIDLAAEGLSPFQQFVIGPQVAYGQSSWPWADVAVDNERQIQVAYLAPGGNYQPYWRTLATGAITITAGSNVVVGSGGTSFQTQYCAGGTSWDKTHFLMWKYPATDGQDHYGQLQPVTCTDASHMTVTMIYPQSPNPPWPKCASGCTMPYGVIDTSSAAYYTWVGAGWGAPANYYDVVEFFLVNYWRSGIDLYYSGAQQMATYWLEWPNLDYFYNTWFATDNYNPGGTAWCSPEPRTYALTGMMLYYQLIGSPTWLYNALENVSNLYNFALQSRLPAWDGLDDLRNDAYTLSGAALMSMLETGSTQTSHQAIIKNSLQTLWTPYRRTGTFTGWNTFYAGGSSIKLLGGGGSINVTNGSNTITGVGTGFNSGLVNSTIWTFPSPAGTAPAYCGTCGSTGNVTDGDAQVYVITAVSGQALTISPTYTGATETWRGFVLGQNGLAGWGIQPFMEGLLAESFFHASQAMAGHDPASQTLFANYGHDAVNLLANYGIPPDEGGFYNGEFFAGCMPPMYNTATYGQLFCYGLSNGYPGPPSDPSQNRIIAGEAMRAFAYDYQLFGTNAAAANLLMNQMFARPGGPGPSYDNYYLSGYDNNPICLPNGTCNAIGYFTGFLVPGNPSYYQFPAKWAGELAGFTEAATVWAGVIADSPVHTSAQAAGKTQQIGSAIR